VRLDSWTTTSGHSVAISSLFPDDAVAMLDEEHEEIERLRRDRHGAPIALERPSGGIEREGAELVADASVHGVALREMDASV
jgi:hypothetical protein